jgi:hypothetical protein
MPVHDWTRVDAGLFHSFRLHWICDLCDSLNGGGLPSAYFALPERPIHWSIEDDLNLHLPPARVGPMGTDTALAVATSPPRARVVQTSERSVYARKADRLTVRHRHGQVVAVIEIVSPGNKGSITELRALIETITRLIQQGVHVLVVDLLPPTKRDPHGIHRAIWYEIDDEDEFSPPADKLLTVAAYSAGAIQTAYVEPIAVGDELPDMPLFLEPEIYVPVPFERTYREAWRAFPSALKGLLEGGDQPIGP